MGGGYFGKLPARKDFVIGNCPKGLLKLWEPFLMGGLAQTRLQLQGDWKEAYMTMPVWRFWLSPGEGDAASARLQTSVAGAFMPSVDGAGREFPLTVVADLGTPEGAPGDDWYDTVEDILRSVLLPDATLERFQEAVAALEPPRDCGAVENRGEERLLAAMPETEGRLGSRFWCRAGDEVFAFGCNGLPAQQEFRWLLLPEHHGTGDAGHETAGDIHGRYHPEDHRT